MESWMVTELAMWAVMLVIFLLIIFLWSWRSSRSVSTAVVAVVFLVFIVGTNVMWQFAIQPHSISLPVKPTPDPTFVAHERMVAEVTRNEKPIFGPANGVISHPSSGLQTVHTGGTLRNFIAQVRVFNPSNWSDGGYNFGFGFKDKPDRSGYRLYITPKGLWFLGQISLVNDVLRTKEIYIFPNTLQFDHEMGNHNFITTIVVGREGTLFVNGSPVWHFEGPTLWQFEGPKENEGGVSLSVGVQDGAKVNPGSTRYEDFTVWRLP